MSDTNDTINSLLGGDAPPVTIEYKGKKFKGRLDQNAKGLWERFLRRQAFVEAFETTNDQTAAARVCTSMGVLKMFKWGSRFSREMLITPDGGVAFAAIVFGCTVEDINGMSADKSGELKDALDAVITESSEDAPAGKEGGVPNPPSGAPS